MVKDTMNREEEFHGPTQPDAADLPSSRTGLLLTEWLLHEGPMKPEWSAIMACRQGEFHTDAVNQAGSDTGGQRGTSGRPSYTECPDCEVHVHSEGVRISHADWAEGSGQPTHLSAVERPMAGEWS